MTKNTFENFLSNKCPCHTNNDPAGFDNWLEKLDGEEYMSYAEEYGNEMYQKGRNDFKSYPYSMDS